MSEYRPTEYVVDFGDCRSNRFVGLNMMLIKQNGAKLHERIVRCRDCKYMSRDMHPLYYCYRPEHEFAVSPNGYCKWGERE